MSGGGEIRYDAPVCAPPVKGFHGLHRAIAGFFGKL
jgi:hypothetical protein